MTQYRLGRESRPVKKHLNLSFTLIIVLFTSVIGGCATTSEPEEPAGAGNGSALIDVMGEGENDDFEPTVVAHRDYRDPLIRFNRAIFAFNDVSYRYVLVPLADGYINVVPDPVQRGVGNFFYNIKAPIYLVNNLLQFKPKAAGTNIARFGINSTIGLLGFFDPATHWFGIEKADTSLEDTLAQYGAGYGVYLVLPLLGSSDLRHGTSAIVEGFMHPVSYISEDRERIAVQGFDYFQEFAPAAGSYEDLIEDSEDPYIFMRNMYLQNIQRDAVHQRRTASEEADE